MDYRMLNFTVRRKPRKFSRTLGSAQSSPTVMRMGIFLCFNSPPEAIVKA
jgi:hypothetical protein